MKLSQRQQQVCERVIAGEKVKAIAESLGIATATAWGYVHTAKAKLGYYSTRELIRRGINP
jgi:DNA-binding NarL/FixJ family response regulator